MAKKATPGKARKDKAIPGYTISFMAKNANSREDNFRQGKARKFQARQDNERQDKAISG